MKYNPDIHHRKSSRLKEYDYSKEGIYYITICTQNRECILSEITNVGAHDCAQIKLTQIGKIVEEELLKTDEINVNIKIHEYIIMPNHVHMIINIDPNEYRAQSCAPTKTIGNVIRGIKSTISAKVGYSIWQRNYYEHVIRNEKDGLYQLLEYLKNNQIKMAVATSRVEKKALNWLKLANVEQYFDVKVFGDAVKNSKPEPDIFLKTIELLKVKADECVVLEDSFNGIIAAYRAKTKPIMIPDLRQPDQEIEKLLYAKCNSLNDVIIILEKTLSEQVVQRDNFGNR